MTSAELARYLYLRWWELTPKGQRRRPLWVELAETERARWCEVAEMAIRVMVAVCMRP